MVTQAIEISLIITAIHVSLWDGMIFGKLRRSFDAMLDRIGADWAKMPLYECNICMGGIWSLILYPMLYGFSMRMIPVMLMVIGANVLIAPVLKYLQDEN